MNPAYSSFGAPPKSLMSTKTFPPDDMATGGPDDNDADVMNDETFGDCDLEAIKIKSDFNENGEFLGEAPLPDFFDSSDAPDNFEGLSMNDPNDQSIDALLGEDPMRVSLSLRPPTTTNNPLFSMAISQARETHPTNLFNPPPPPQPAPPPTQVSSANYAILKQYEQMLINQQVPPHERVLHLQALIERMQRNVRPPMNNGHERNGYPQPPPPMAIGEMMERARLSAMNANNSRSQSPGMPPPPFSSQLIDAIQRSDQIPIAELVQRPSQSPSSPKETVVSPSHHRHNRPSKFYPRPPCLNTWQGRGPNHDEFAGMMNDREKQWVVKIQLHQVSQAKEEDFYFQKWSQVRRQMQNTQLNRHDHRGQYIIYPVLQLLKSIQQEKELADRLSQNSAQATFTNVNPNPALPYATPLQNPLGKQSVATHRHPRCTLHLDGEFALGTRADAITHKKYHLGLRLHVENLYRDLLRLDEEDDAEKKSVLLQSIVQGYVNHSTYLFADLFGDVSRARLLLERLYPQISSSKELLELILMRFYGSLSYMIHRASTNFHIEPIVLNVISSMQQEILPKIKSFEEIFSFYNERLRSRVNGNPASPFADPILFTHSISVSLLIEFLILMERRCYLPSGVNPSNLPIQILQQLQPQLQYQLSEQVRVAVSDVCQALLTCSNPKKMLKPFGQAHHQQLGLLLKFLRIQFNNEIYPTLESKLLQTCVKSD